MMGMATLSRLKLQDGGELGEAPAITWHTLDRVLAEVANERRELLVTTFAGFSEDEEYERNFGMAAWNLNFLEHLRRVNVTRNILVVGCSAQACDATLALGLPCWQDLLGWQTKTEFFRGRQVALKWFYMQQIVQRNYHPIFLDNDVVVLQNFFEIWDRSFDFQGLYDTDGGTDPAALSDPEDPTEAECPLTRSGEYKYHWPCMSTGIMLVRATKPALALITAMVTRLELEPKHWEQRMFQVEVLRFVYPDLLSSFFDLQRGLIQSAEQAQLSNGKDGQWEGGDGPEKQLDRRRLLGQDREELRFQLLPLRQYHNVNTYRARGRLGLDVDTVMIHCGYIHGFEKIVHLQALGLWLLTSDEELYQQV